MMKLGNFDGRFIVQLLELRRAAVFGGARAIVQGVSAELKRLDAVLTQIKAKLPQITDPEIAEAVKLVVACEGGGWK